MPSIQEIFTQTLSQYSLDPDKIYPTGGGQVALNPQGTLAIVYTDGRYPEIEKGFSLNSICTETITVLYGAVVLEIDSELKVFTEGQKIVVSPQQKYSIAGKAVSKVEINPAWDSSQNTFVK